jgi:hypothetical protein
LTVQEILANKESIYACAKAFREDANALMLQLSREFNFNLNEYEEWPTTVFKTNYKNKGMMNGGWTFYFHGSHCHFHNLNTGQVVEVKYIEKTEFGCVDGFFLYTYMQTTERFKDRAKWFNHHRAVYEALDILVEEGTLTKKLSIPFDSCILAL